MVCLCEDANILGQTFYVMEYVPGRIFGNNGTGLHLDEFTPAQRAALFDDMINVLAKLHSLDFSAYGLSDYGKVGNHAERQLKTWGRNYKAQDDVVNKFKDQ